MSDCIVFTNWKMNKTLEECKSFFRELVDRFGAYSSLELIMCIPSLYIGFASPLCRDTCIGVGSENLYPGEWGPYTGEISAPMLKSAGCGYALMGHSERRRYFQENDEFVNKKLLSALRHGLHPIVCIGETGEERDDGRTLEILERQVMVVLKGISERQKVYLAYEPRWAIGTGVTPEQREIEDAHLFIRRRIESLYGASISSNIRLLYGGSVTPENTFEICSLDGVDGVGFGGCSLDLDCLGRGIEASVKAYR
jgi:triosephosphate isomerase